MNSFSRGRDLLITYIQDLDLIFYKKQAILDLSTFPELSRLGSRSFESSSKSSNSNNEYVYYIPDTIFQLFEAAKRNAYYYYYIGRLFSRWSRRAVDVKIIEKILKERVVFGRKLLPITLEDVDMTIYEKCNSYLRAPDLEIELSPKKNILGDLLGKIFGFSSKSGSPILMLNRRLRNEVKKLTDIIEITNAFVDSKQNFFEKFFPVKRTRGIRWILGITIGAYYTPLGFALTLVDP